MKKSVVSPGAITKANVDLQTLAKSIGRVVNGNTSTTGASQGQYVVLLNSTISGRADGLYTAAQAIPANTAITSAYLTASSTGGLNALADQMATKEISFTTGTNVTSSTSKVKKAGNIAFISVSINTSAVLSGYNTLISLTDYIADGDTSGVLYKQSDGSILNYGVYLNNGTSDVKLAGNSNLPSGSYALRITSLVKASS